MPLPTARNAQGRPLTSQTIAANDAEGAEGGVRIRYYHCDQIGTPRELTRPTGEITWQATYKAWGNTQTVQWEVAVGAAQGQTIIDVEHDRVDRSGQQPLRFQGQYFDEETGLHYNRFRYYDPDSGRFISHDPIGLLGGVNLFQYAPNPVEWADPWGLTGNPATATHITYRGVKNGKPYIGYASMQGCQEPRDVLNYRYSGNFGDFDGGRAPTVLYSGYGQSGKDLTRGMVQHEFEKAGGLKNTSNKQNPVGKKNGRKDIYKAAAENHCPCGNPKKPDDC